jgi:hypothetical protein
MTWLPLGKITSRTAKCTYAPPRPGPMSFPPFRRSCWMHLKRSTRKAITTSGPVFQNQNPRWAITSARSVVPSISRSCHCSRPSLPAYVRDRAVASGELTRDRGAAVGALIHQGHGKELFALGERPAGEAGSSRQKFVGTNGTAETTSSKSMKSLVNRGVVEWWRRGESNHEGVLYPLNLWKNKALLTLQTPRRTFIVQKHVQN